MYSLPSNSKKNITPLILDIIVIFPSSISSLLLDKIISILLGKFIELSLNSQYFPVKPSLHIHLGNKYPETLYVSHD